MSVIVTFFIDLSDDIICKARGIKSAFKSFCYIVGISSVKVLTVGAALFKLASIPFQFISKKKNKKTPQQIPWKIWNKCKNEMNKKYLS